jgi:OOP family OmpA-OmpF porin
MSWFAGRYGVGFPYIFLGGSLMKNRLVVSLLGFALMGLPLAGCHSQAHVATEAKAPAPPPPAEPEKKEEPSPIVDNKIVLPGELEFEVSSAKIKESDQSMSILNELAKVLTQNPQITKLRIEGHTDASGRAKKNLRLSKDRADSVAKWLGAHEIASSRLTTVGLGDTHPLMDNDTPEHRAMNRRTEFHLQEVDGKPVTDDNAPAQKVASR